MSTKRPLDQSRIENRPAVDPRPFGLADLAVVQHLLGEIAPDWSAELQGVCADEAILALLPDGGDDEIGPSFMISREAGGLRVDQIHWDVVTEVGVFVSLVAAMRALRLRLVFCAAGPAPRSYTLH